MIPATSEFMPATRLSASPLWNVLRQAYESSGAEAWDRGVIPSYITSNASLAYRYCRLVMGWIRDLEDAGQLRSKEAFNIVELGTGTGRFAFHMLRTLEELQDAPVLKRHNWSYLATDLSEPRLRQIEDRPQFRQFIGNGKLRTAVYDALAGNHQLAESATPLVVIANYVFDSLPADCFRVQDGDLFETMIAIRDHEMDLELDKVEWQFSHRRIGLPHYHDAVLDSVLERQVAKGVSRSFLLPTGALQVLKNLRQVAGGPLLVLVADKTPVVPPDKMSEARPVIEMHGISHFSVSLELDLVADIIEAQGGHMIQSRRGREVIAFAACTLGGAQGTIFPEMRLAFEGCYEQSNSVGELYLSARLHELVQSLSLHDHLAWLRMVHYDPDRWSSIYPFFLRTATSPPAELRPELFEALERLAARSFPLADEKPDIPFLVGCTFLVLNEAEAARRHLDRSIVESGSSPAAEFQLGRAEFLAGDRRRGASRSREALKADPDLGGTLELMGLLRRSEVRSMVEQMEWQANLPAGSGQFVSGTGTQGTDAGSPI